MRQAGFSLLEVLVSLVLFSVFAIGVAQSFVFQTKTNTDSEIRSQAIQAAQRVLDRIRSDDPGSLPSSGAAADESVVVDGKNFIVKVSYCIVSTYCTSATTRHIRATVNFLGKKRYEVDTVFAQLQ